MAALTMESVRLSELAFGTLSWVMRVVAFVGRSQLSQ